MQGYMPLQSIDLESSTHKVSVPGLLCGLVIVLSLLGGQTGKFFPSSGNALYYLLLFAKYIGTILLYLYSRKYRKLASSEVKRFKKLLVPVFIFFACVEIIALFSSPVPRTYGLRYWTRSMSAFVDRLLTYLLVISIWKLRREKALKCMLSALLFDQLLVFLLVIYQNGISGVVSSISNAFFFHGFDANYFEVHELTFCIGFFVIYYLFFAEGRRNKRGLILLLIFLFILGGKRIGFFGILAAGLYSFLVRKKGLSKRMLTVTGLIGISICFAFLMVIYDDRFMTFLGTHDINSMGRDLIYGYFTRRSSFSPTYLGWGIAGTSKVVENMDRAEVLYMQAVRGVHSNILSDYINYGFLGYLIWSIYNLLYLPRKYFDYYGKKSATLYICCLIYAYITYLTDNTEGYFIFQTTLWLIPISEYLINTYGGIPKYSMHKRRSRT